MNRRLLWLPLIALITTMTVARSVLAAPGDITLASTSDTGVKGNGISFDSSFSAVCCSHFHAKTAAYTVRSPWLPTHGNLAPTMDFFTTSDSFTVGFLFSNNCNGSTYISPETAGRFT